MQIEPHQLARDEAVLAVRVPASIFPRLVEFVEEASAPVVVDVTFSHDARGRVRARGSLETRVRVRCGNCERLEPVALLAKVDLCIIRDDAEAAEIMDEADPVVLDARACEMAALFEDDLVLSLPERACEDPASCPWNRVHREDRVAEPQRENPFAVLQSLRED